MLLEKSCLMNKAKGHTTSFRANLDQHYCESPGYTLISRSNDIYHVKQDPGLVLNEDLKMVWLRDINIFGRRYIKGWVRRGLNRLDTSYCEFNSFLNLIKLSGPCNFAKRDLMYDDLKVLCLEREYGLLISRKRFKLLVIAWHYVNQSYFQRKDLIAFQQLAPAYQIDSKVLRRFEGYYQMRLKTKISEF